MFGLGNGYACTPSVIFMFFFKKKLSSWFGLAYTNSRHCWTGVKRPLNFTVQKYKIMLLKRKSQMESSAARTVLSAFQVQKRVIVFPDWRIPIFLGGWVSRQLEFIPLFCLTAAARCDPQLSGSISIQQTLKN